jgi:hypothetical protein
LNQTNKSTTPQTHQEFGIGWKPFVYLILPVTLIAVTYGYLLFTFVPESAERGLFGDAFGALNALFSGLGFAGLFYTIILQQKQLHLQSRELFLNREEFHKSATANQQTAVALTKQLETQIIATRISACGMLLNSYNEQLDEWEESEGESYRSKKPIDVSRIRKQRDMIEQQLQALLQKIEQEHIPS